MESGPRMCGGRVTLRIDGAARAPKGRTERDREQFKLDNPDPM